MSHDQRRAAIVRAWLAVLATVAIASYSPVLAAVVASSLPIVAGFWMACCGGTTCSCTDCTVEPCDIEVVFSGISDANAECGDCDQHNGTFVLTDAVANNTCAWVLLLDPEFCEGDGTSPPPAPTSSVNITASVGFGGTYILTIQYVSAGGTNIPFTWTEDFGASKPDCSAWSGQNVTFNSENSPACQTDGSAAVVTAL